MINSSAAPRDESTRRLCAAAHLDPEFANAAIREFLVEPTRAVGPSPGVDSEPVLREAIAARSRRRTRDGLLVALLALFTLFAPAVLAAWVLVALAACAGRVRTWQNLTAKRDLAKTLRLAAGLGVGALVIYLVTSTGLPSLLDGGTTSYRTVPVQADDADLGPLLAVLASVVFVLMAAVLLVDRLVVWALVTRSFRRGRFEVDPKVGDRWPHEWEVRRKGHQYFDHELPRIRPAWNGQGAEVVVYRGYHPFVGAGLPYQPWSVAIPLHASDPEAEPKPFTLRELYDALERDLHDLGSSPSLSPSNRLRDLAVFERVVVPADDLLAWIGDPVSTAVLPNIREKPKRHLPDDVVQRIVEEPLEWMRYFRCFQLETWDRDLVISAYLHLGSDRNNLYLEWTPCVLLPLHEKHRRFDEWPAASWRPVVEAFGKLLRLPVTIFGRFSHAVTRIRPIPEESGLLLAEKYGAMVSLRELASGETVEDYFQRTDLERYVKVLDARVVRSVGRFLEDKGLGSAEFMERVQQVVNNNMHIEGSVGGNAFIGDHNKTGDVTKS
ncbi:MAG TPA: hypothetical protein VNO31_01885 [Umezawaea sp.]|nr:hypothetical protein [Umezawaea sp.]